jgi:hypothetical protein
MADRQFLGTSAIYTIVAPVRCARARPTPGLGSRRLFRWQLVRETRRPAPAGQISVWSYEHISCHWTWRAAERARYGLLDPTAGE